MASVRLQKVLAHAGIASRRAAEELISAGRVRVDGRIVTELGTKVDSRADKIEVDGVRIVRESPVYLILHKPRGIVSTMSDPEGRGTVRDLLTEVSSARAYPVGRLDFNTSGALLATNDGDFAVALMHPSKSVPKTYVLKVQGVMEDHDIDQWRRGVNLDDGKTLPSRIKLLRHEGDKTWLELTITEGRNQQIRRMGEATGFRVMRLARISFAGISTEGLAPGRWRYLTHDELSNMKKQFGVPKRAVSPPAETDVRAAKKAQAARKTATTGPTTSGLSPSAAARGRGPRGPRRDDDTRGAWDARGARGSADTRGAKGARSATDTRSPRSAKGPTDTRGARGPTDTRGAKGATAGGRRAERTRPDETRAPGAAGGYRGKGRHG